MENDKKEKNYFGVKVSEIDEKLVKKIEKQQRIFLIATLIFLPCVLLNLILLLLHDYIGDTALMVCSSIIIVVTCGVIVLEVLYLVNIIKLKKEVKKTQKSPKDSEK